MSQVTQPEQSAQPRTVVVESSLTGFGNCLSNVISTLFAVFVLIFLCVLVTGGTFALRRDCVELKLGQSAYYQINTCEELPR